MHRYYINQIIFSRTFSTDDNVVFESKHFPELKMGIENKNEGFLTSKNEALQHFRVVQGLCGEDGTISFESIAKSGYFLRHRGFKIFLDKWSDKDLFKKDSCFYPTYDENFEVRKLVFRFSKPNKLSFPIHM